MSTDSTRFSVQLPSHSYSFHVSVPSSSTVLQLKDTISETCPGRPTRAGQRVIYKGRIINDESVVSDVWNSGDDEYTIHVAVNPSAWTSSPPQTTSNAPSPPPRARSSPPPPLSAPSQSTSSFHPPEPPFSIAFIHHAHINALRILCRLPPVAWWGITSDLAGARAFSKSTVEATGGSWPTILDMEYPIAVPTDSEGVQYGVVFNDSLPYLVLETPGASPTALQRHALRVLEATLPLLNQTPLIQAQFLQQVAQALQSTAAVTARAFPPQTAGRRHNAAGFFAGAAVQPLVQIQFRALLLPLAMLIFRASLLLYIFSPARRPLFAAMIAAWCAWEVYAAVRAAMVGPDNARAGPAPPAGPGGAANMPPAPAPGPQANAPAAVVQAAVFGPGNQDQDILTRLANLDLAHQAALLEPGAPPAPPPTLVQRTKSFFTLLALSLDPAWWNRRRRALRNREGQLRTTYRQVPEESQQHGAATVGEGQDGTQPAEPPRPAPPQPPAGWAAAYVERVRNVEWIDE